MLIMGIYPLNFTKNTLNKEYGTVMLNSDLYVLTLKIHSKNTNFKYIKCYILI